MLERTGPRSLATVLLTAILFILILLNEPTRVPVFRYLLTDRLLISQKIFLWLKSVFWVANRLGNPQKIDRSVRRFYSTLPEE